MIDTHSHIYSEEFDADRAEAIQRAKDAGVSRIILPNVDSESLVRMLELEAEYPNYCFATIGLHPTSVETDYETELALVKSELERRSYVAIGEIGIDLYWDKTFFKEQSFVFQQQLDWALEYGLPVIIHVRNSFRETMDLLAPYKDRGLKGVFHSFTGGVEEAKEIIEFGGFRLGINGIVTFKNSNLTNTLHEIDIEYLVLETDAPYLTPVPFRGKRNESAYVKYVLEKLSEVYSKSESELDKILEANTFELFSKIR